VKVGCSANYLQGTMILCQPHEQLYSLFLFTMSYEWYMYNSVQ